MKTYLLLLSKIMIVVTLVWSQSSVAQSFYQSDKLNLMTRIIEQAVKHDLDPILALSVAKVESNFDANALSYAGAIGVMQIMPATAMGEFKVASHQLYDANINIALGVKYLKQLSRRYNDQIEIVLSHYNGGSGVQGANGQLKVLPATQGYVAKVFSTMKTFRSHGLVNKLIQQQASQYLAQHQPTYINQQYDDSSKALSAAQLKKLQQVRTLRRHNLTRQQTDLPAVLQPENKPVISQNPEIQARQLKVQQWESIYQANGQLTQY